MVDEAYHCRKLKLSLHWERMTTHQVRRSAMELGAIASLTSLTHLDLKTPYSRSLECISELGSLRHLSLHIADQLDYSAFVPVIDDQTQLTCIQLSVDTIRGWGYLQQVETYSSSSTNPPPSPFIPNPQNHPRPSTSHIGVCLLKIAKEGTIFYLKSRNGATIFLLDPLTFPSIRNPPPSLSLLQPLHPPRHKP